MENATNQQDEKGHDANIVLAVSGLTESFLEWLTTNFEYVDGDWYWKDDGEGDMNLSHSNILELYQAACASSAVDKTVSDGCFCGSKDFVTRHMIRQCADCGRPV